MRNWYNTLSPRERGLVTYGSIAVLLILFWVVLVNPLKNQHTRLNLLIDQQQKSLVTMKKQSIQIKALQAQEKSKPATTNNQNPQQLIERSLQTWRLKNDLERMQSQGINSVRLILKNANADRVMRFLYELENSYNLSIDNMAISRKNKESGLADFRLTIKRGQS